MKLFAGTPAECSMLALQPQETPSHQDWIAWSPARTYGTALSEKLPILAAPLRLFTPSAVNPCENSYKPYMLSNNSSLATFLSLTVQAHVHSVTHVQLWKPQDTYIRRAIWKAHFKWNWAFKGHPYWCQQKSGMECCYNAQWCRPYLWNSLRYSNEKSANLSISYTPLPVWLICTTSLYCQKLMLLT